jgi:hypothetical protein
MYDASIGESVSASLIVSCGFLAFEPGSDRLASSGSGPRLFANVWFSRPAVVEGSRREGRLRIDEGSVQVINPRSHSRETIEVYFPGRGPHDAMAPLFGSKRLRVATAGGGGTN